MENYKQHEQLKHVFRTLAAMACFTTAQAQVKVGANLGTINAGSALEIEATNTKNLWVRIGLSSSNTTISQTGFTSLGSSLASGWLAPSMVNGEGGYTMITGVIPIQVTNTSITVYTWFYGVGATFTSITAGIGANGENYFFAIPIN